MNNNYRLQLRHGAEGKNFSTRDDVFAYIDGQLQYGGVSLLPYEPILFYYGEDEKNTIIMVGLPEGELNNGKSYFIIDTADLKEQIDSFDEKYDAVIEELKAKDAELQEAIETETEERKAADEAEAEERKSADEAEAVARAEKDSELEKAIEDEADARVKGDEKLQEALDFTKDDLKSIIEACGLLYNEKLADDRVSYEPDSHDEVIRDAKDITEAIDKVSKFATQLAKDLKISVANTDTVNLTMTPNDKEGGNTITADVNIAGTEGLSKKNYDNNLIGKTVEGLYASASLEPSSTNPNKLIFKTSGYVDGVFKVDAFETEVDLTAYKGDNGKTTGITVDVDTTENKISAELNLSSSKNNILKLEDGEYIVEGSSKNITYKDGTVFSALNEQSNRIEDIEDAIEFVKAVDVKPSESETVITTVDKSSKGDFVVGANVKLSNDKSIIVSNGGLKADVSASFKKGTSTLFINVGNNEYAIDLSDLAVSVLKSATYDASNEELVLEFIVGDTTKTVRVPVGTLIHDVEVDDTDTVDMTLKTVSGGPNHISAEVKIDKTHSDNIITVTSNGLYVAKAYITEAVKDEATERKEADNELKSKLTEVSQLASDNKDAIKNEATTARAAEKANADAIAQEVKDARAAEKANADAIAENKVAIKANETAIDAEEGRAKAAEQANATAITAEETRAMAAEAKNANSIDAEITRATEKEADLLEKIGANTEKITETKTAIDSEVDRATKAEKAVEDKANANDAAIKAESERAKLAEQANSTAVANEVSRATAAESANTTAINSEKERAMAAETVVTEKAEGAKTIAENAKNVADAAKSELTDEITRAKAAEEANATAIAKEISDARAAETELRKDLTDAIGVEKARAEHAESDLAEKIAKNTTDIETINTEVGNIELKKEGELSYALYVNGTKHGEFTIPKDQFLKSVTYDPFTKELVFVFDTTSGESTTRVSIADLVNVYEAGEGIVLNGNVFSVDLTKIATIESVNAAISAEKTRAKAAEEANAKAIAEEIKDARDAEADIRKDLLDTVSAETNRATTAEGVLNSTIAREIDEARAAEAKVKSDLEVAIANEKERAMTAEGANKAGIENIDKKVENVKTDLASAVSSISNISKDLATEVARSLGKDTEIENSLTKTQNDLNATNLNVAENANSISNLAKDLASEISRSTVKDADIEQSIEIVSNAAASAKTKAEGVEVKVSEINKNLSDEITRSTLKDSELETAIASANKLINTKANSSDVYTQAEMLDRLSSYAKTSDVNSALANKLNVTDAQNVYATKSELEDVKDASATKSDVNSALASKLNVTDAQNVYATKSELEDVKDAAAKTVDVDTKLSSKLNIAEAQSTYATKEEVQDVKTKYATTEDLGNVNSQLNSRIDNNKESIDNIDFRFNNTTSELIYTDKNGNEHPFKLYGASLVKEGHFDAATNSIVLTIENAGVESQITIPVSELLSDLSGKIDVNAKAIEDINTELATLAKKWEANSSSSVELTKTNDTLTAKVLIASGTRQALQSNENGLFVSNDLQDSTCVFGEEGTISGQDAISKLLASTTKMGQELEKKLNILDAQNTYATKADLHSLDGKVETLKSEVTSQKSDISLIKKDVQSNKEGVAEAKESIKNVEGRVTSTETRLTTVESNISNLETRINSTEKEIVDIKNDVKNITEVKLVELTNAINTLKATVEALAAPGGQVANLLAEISKIKTVTAYDTYTNTKNMSARLDTLETEIGGGVAEELDNIKNNLIGPKDGSVAGSVWYELNNMVDAGTF